jgi:galactose mutarotase-like enzyme
MPITRENAILISNGGTTAEINLKTSQLFSLVRGEVDVMWKGGAPESHRAQSGWPNSEMTMFPIIGRAVTGDAEDTILVGGRKFSMSRHGIARDMPWILRSATSEKIVMSQYYNESFIVDRGLVHSSFPYSYALTKAYSINSRGMLEFKIAVKNRSGVVLPYSVGWQPAFVTPGRPFFDLVGEGHFSNHLEFVRHARGNVIPFQYKEEARYHTDGFNIVLKHDFGWGTQVWDEGRGYVAFAPISAQPLNRSGREDSMDLLLRKDFKKLEPGGINIFTTEISIDCWKQTVQRFKT